MRKAAGSPGEKRGGPPKSAKPSPSKNYLPVQQERVGRPVLLIEDNEDDIFFIERAWKQTGVSIPLAVVRDGQQALDYLAGAGRYADRTQHPRPCLVLLDWKLPYLMGVELLKWIRQHPVSKTLPVLVLATSGQKADIDQAYRLGANAYLEKPSAEGRLLDLVKLIQSFWLGAIRLPSNQA